MRVILDAGALVAIDRRDRATGARLRILQQRHVPVRTSAAVVAQVWRDCRRQVNLARVLTGVDAEPLRGDDGKRIGELLASTRSSDVVDGHVAQLTEPGDVVLTSDPADIRTLLAARGIVAGILAV